MPAPMPRINYSRYREAFLLYMINVYQPCTPARLRDLVRATSIEAFKGITDDQLQEILSAAEKHGFLIRTKDGQLHLTYFGLRLISKRRFAFPRDKNRLFYLKDVT
jgi:hypothetical protein